jgi:hypothetical protein
MVRTVAADDKCRRAVSRARIGDVPLAVGQHVACPTAIVPLDRREESRDDHL